MPQRLLRLELRCYQGHKRKIIKFDKRITCIIGPTDAGKSSIIRALKWIAFNKPTNKRMIRNGSRTASARLYLEGNRSIERRRGRTKDNLYIVNGRELHAFGAAVPHPVSKLLRISKENFQSQHDSAFWLSDNTSIVSKALNKIAGLDSVDKALAIIGKETRTAKQSLAFNRERLRDAKSRKEALKTAPVCLAEGKKLIRDAKRIEALDRTILKLENCINKSQRSRAATKTVIDSRTTRAIERSIAHLEALDRKLESIATKEARLQSLVASISQAKETVCQNQVQIKSLEKQIGTLTKRCPKCGNLIQSA